MKPSALPTRAVAEVLGVTETTVKRWADEGIIPCTRTPGGHRKFLLKDVSEFARANGLILTGTTPPPMSPVQMEQLHIGTALKDYPRLSAVFQQEALQADRQGLHQLLLYLLTHHISFPAIADEVIRPAMAEIGSLWEKGKLYVNQEHAATHAVLEALAQVAPELHRKPEKSIAVVCSCPEYELHDIGLRCLAYSLEAEGWNVHYIGANTPAGDVLRVVRTEHPPLVCVSVTITRYKKRVAAQLRSIVRVAHAYGGVVIIGGYGADQVKKLDIACDYVAAGIQDTLAFIRERFQLRPGPRKKNDHAKLHSS